MGQQNTEHGKACALAHLEFRLYDLRHTFATRAAANGMDLPTLGYVLGHADLSTLRRYVHPQQDHVNEQLTANEKASKLRFAEFMRKQLEIVRFEK